jgi:hypothetical protein
LSANLHVKLLSACQAAVWNAAGTAENDRTKFEGELFLKRALGGSFVNVADDLEAMFATYEG